MANPIIKNDQILSSIFKLPVLNEVQEELVDTAAPESSGFLEVTSLVGTTTVQPLSSASSHFSPSTTILQTTSEEFLETDILTTTPSQNDISSQIYPTTRTKPTTTDIDFDSTESLIKSTSNNPSVNTTKSNLNTNNTSNLQREGVNMPILNLNQISPNRSPSNRPVNPSNGNLSIIDREKIRQALSSSSGSNSTLKTTATIASSLNNSKESVNATQNIEPPSNVITNELIKIDIIKNIILQPEVPKPGKILNIDNLLLERG